MSENKKKNWIVIAIFVILGWFGVSKIIEIASSYSAHQKTLAEVKTLASTNTDINNIPNLESLKSTKTTIEQSITKLKEVPNLPGYPYQDAQNQISQLNNILAKLDSKIKTEDEALSNLQTAQRLDAEAARLVQSKTYSTSWQEAKSKWEQAISLLKKIPTGTFVSDTAKSGITAVERNFNDVGQFITGEEKSLKNFTTAVETAHKAFSLTKDTTSITLPDLLNAKSQWQQAINLLTQVGADSHVSTKLQSQLGAYRNNYREVSKAIDDIKKCTSQNTSSEISCTDSISLTGITEPQTLTALLPPPPEEPVDTQVASAPDYSSTTESDNSSSTYSSTGSSSYYSSPSYSGYRSYSGSRVFVRSYTKSDGTHVGSHYRSSPGSRSSGFGSFRSGGSGS